MPQFSYTPPHTHLCDQDSAQRVGDGRLHSNQIKHNFIILIGDDVDAEAGFEGGQEVGRFTGGPIHL